MFEIQRKLGETKTWINLGSYGDVNEAKDDARKWLRTVSWLIVRVVALNPAGRVIRIIASYEDPEAV